MPKISTLTYYESVLRLIESQVVRFEVGLAALHAEGKDDDEIARELRALYGRRFVALDQATRAAISAWRRVIPKGGNGGGGGQRVLEKGGTKKRTPGDDGR